MSAPTSPSFAAASSTANSSVSGSGIDIGTYETLQIELLTHEAQPAETATGVVARIWLDRPAVRNAFDDLSLRELQAVFTALGAAPAIRAIVLAARGPAFCAGADLRWMARMADYTPAQNLADAQALAELLHTLDTCPKPVIARVHGACFAGALGLVAACDLAAATHDARFALTEVKLGLLPATIAPYVQRAIGPRALRRYALTAERFDAAEAFRLGLLHDLAPDAAALDALIDAWLEALLSNAPGAMADTKRLLADLDPATPNAAIRADTAQRIAQARASAEGRVGLRAFLDKQPPPWALP